MKIWVKFCSLPEKYNVKCQNKIKRYIQNNQIDQIQCKNFILP